MWKAWRGSPGQHHRRAVHWVSQTLVVSLVIVNWLQIQPDRSPQLASATTPSEDRVPPGLSLHETGDLSTAAARARPAVWPLMRTMGGVSRPSSNTDQARRETRDCAAVALRCRRTCGASNDSITSLPVPSLVRLQYLF